MGLKIIDKMGWYWTFFQKASVFSALQVYLDFINLFLYIIRLMNWNRKQEKIFQENRSSFARIKISGILRKTEYENPVFGVDGFILLAEREAFCNKFDRFYLKFLY